MRDLNLFFKAFIENTVAFFQKADIVNLRNKEEVFRQVNLPNGMCMVCSNHGHLAISEWREDVDNSGCNNVLIDLKTKDGARLVFDRDVIGRSGHSRRWSSSGGACVGCIVFGSEFLPIKVMWPGAASVQVCHQSALLFNQRSASIQSAVRHSKLKRWN